ncbi:MAG: U32 family peptidase [Christensenellales bacterium]
MIELLAPAGDLASFQAAMHAGADAVYLGAQNYGARAGAGFHREALQTALAEAHLRGKRVYVTFNTLIKEAEFADAAAQLKDLDAMGVDAVLVQDLGILAFIKRELPGLPVHASTQMSIHNRAGAELLLSLGLSRVVLARECSFETIRSVAATGIETEVFVHGALCVAVSGQCLLSSQIGGRSGNRGRCAQPCRLAYSYRGKPGAWLSPRDLNLLPAVPQLLQAGVCSFKIEGRLKRPEYVAIATAAYRRAIDAALAGVPNLHLEEDQQSLLQVFNRGGFTQGQAFGAQDAALIHPLRVSHEGILLGVVKACQPRGRMYLSDILLAVPLHDGDNLQIRGAQEDQEMIYAGPEIPAGHMATIRHYKPGRPGEPVYRLVDARQMQQARAAIAKPLPPIPLRARLDARPGEPLSLWLSDGTVQGVTTGAVPQTAQAQPMTLHSTRASIEKMGDSPFMLADYNFRGDEPLFLPASKLNALRREALEAMTRARQLAHKREAAKLSSFLPKPAGDRLQDGPALYVRSADLSLRKAFADAGATHFLHSPQDYTDPALGSAGRALQPGDYLCLPPQASDETLLMLRGLAAAQGLSVMLDNVGQLGLSWPGPVMAGGGIPVWNGESIRFLRDRGCTAAIVSPETSKVELQALPADELPLILPVYGRARLMLLNHCPERTYRGLSGDKRSCRLCERGEGTIGQALGDRMGMAFPLCPIRLPEGCLNLLMHNRPVHLSKRAVTGRWLLAFTTETAGEALAITRYYAALLRGERDLPPLDVPPYAGRFIEGVE